MHETHLLDPIIQGIIQHAQREKAQSVTVVRLKVGQFLGVKEDHLRETFQVLAKGTLLESAQLEMTAFPGYRIEVISFDIA